MWQQRKASMSDISMKIHSLIHFLTILVTMRPVKKILVSHPLLTQTNKCKRRGISGKKMLKQAFSGDKNNNWCRIFSGCKVLSYVHICVRKMHFNINIYVYFLNEWGIYFFGSYKTLAIHIYIMRSRGKHTICCQYRACTGT